MTSFFIELHTLEDQGGKLLQTFTFSALPDK